MKYISETEALAIQTKPVGKVTLLRSMLVNLQPGSYLQVDKAEWKWKRKTPSALCQRIEKDSSLKFECRRMLNGAGWLIKRIK